VAEHGRRPAGKCANCHAPLRGPYCFVCGQRVDTHIHSFWEFLQEAFEGITHADSRVWRTVWPLLFRPGLLTAEYFAGRRSRYLPPFRLYLVVTVVFFLVAAALPHSPALMSVDDNLQGVTVTPLGGNAERTKETPEQRATRICSDMTYQGPWQAQIQPRFTTSCHKMLLDHGDSVVEGLLRNLPRALFVLLPLMALVMRVLYLRRYYVEHLLFFIHTHSFIFLLLLLFLPLASWLSDGWLLDMLTLVVTLYIPWYVYRAMRRYYGQGRWATAGKYLIVMVAYLACASLMLMITTLYTIITL
jgi:hypothetical protein